MKKKLGTVGMAAFLILVGTVVCPAMDYPNKPITLIVPQNQGGGHDLLGRAFAGIAEKLFGQAVVVVNKPGASGITGMMMVVEALPDGYTLGLDSTAHANVVEWEIANGRKPPFTQKDLVPIGSFTLSPALVVVPANSPWKTLSDLIRECKAKPDVYTFCSGSLFGGTHLPAEVLVRAAGLKARHAPYKGGGPCLSALVGEQVHFATQWPHTSIPLARDNNKIRVLAVQGPRRLNSIPEVPTVKELGIDAEWQQWIGISAPKKTPLLIVEKLREVVRKVTEDKFFITLLEVQGDEVRFMNGDELARFQKIESERLAKLYKQLIEEKR